MSAQLNVHDATLSFITVHNEAIARPFLAICFNQNSKHNIISESFLSSLAYGIEVAYRLIREDRVCAVVFCSAKDSFIVGADIQFQLALNSAEKYVSVL